MKDFYVCGVDEVGRGALAGSIIAVATLFKFDDVLNMSTCPVPNLTDSKAYSSTKKREAVWKMVLNCPFLLDFRVGEASVDEINEKGIDWCNNVIFQRAIGRLSKTPDMVYVDGSNPVMGWPVERQHVEPKADLKYWPVSAASVLAKVIRDRMMGELNRKHPGYDWGSNMGYGSYNHKMGLRRLGSCEQHRSHFIRKIISEPASMKYAPYLHEAI